MQMCNAYLFYTYLLDKIPDNAEMQVTTAEIFVPLFMMWTLCLIHSQIVATNPGSDKAHLKTRSQKNIKKKFSRMKYVNYD